MTTEQLKQLQSMLDDAKYSIQQLQNYYGKVMDNDNDSHQEGYGLLTTADYARDGTSRFRRNSHTRSGSF